MNENELARDRARFFTAARQFQTLFGKLPDGTKIPGGPYSALQGAVAVLVIMVGLLTRSWNWWTFGNIALDYAMLAVLAFGMLLLAGLVPMQKRNVATVGFAAGHAILSPAVGRRNGRPVRIRTPHRVVSDIVIDWDQDKLNSSVLAPAEPSRIDTGPTTPATTPAASASAPLAVSGVERLLQQTRSN